MVAVSLVNLVCRNMGIGCTAEPDLVPAANEEDSALLLVNMALADLEVTLEDKLGLKILA